MEFVVDNIDVLRRIKDNVTNNIFISSEFYTGVRLTATLDDLDLDMFGCWNGGCNDKFSNSNKGSIHQQFLVNIMNNYNQNNKQIKNKLRMTFGDNLYFEKTIKKIIKEDKSLKKKINSAGILNDIPRVNDIDMKEYSQKLINKGFECLENKPTFMCLGNHDLEPLFVLHQQIKKAYDTVLISEDKVKFQSNWILPNAFYAVNLKVQDTNLLFVFIDTNLLDGEYPDYVLTPDLVKQYKERMLDWLNRTLGQHPNHIKFVIGHCPLFYYAHKKEKSEIAFTTRQIPGSDAGENFIRLYDSLIRNNVKFYMAADEHNLQYIVDREHDITHLTCGASPGGGGGDETNSFSETPELYFSSSEIQVPGPIKDKFVKKLILNAPAFMKLNLHQNMVQINLIGPANLSAHSSLICKDDRCVPTDRIRAVPEIYSIITVPKFLEYVSVYNCEEFKRENCK